MFDDNVYWKVKNQKGDITENINFLDNLNSLKSLIKDNKKILHHKTYCYNKDELSFKISYLRNYFYLEKGYGPWSDYKKFMPINANMLNVYVEKIFDQIANDYIVNQKSKYKQNLNVQIDFDLNEFYFLPLQVSTDTVSKTMRMSWINLIKDCIYFFKRNNMRLLIKNHPKNHDKSIQRLINKKCDNKNIFLTNASIHSILPYVKAVICGNSGVGFESLIYLKPVFTFASVDYDCVTYKMYKTSDLGNMEAYLLQHNSKLIDIKYFVVDFIKNWLVYVDDLNKIKQRLEFYGFLKN